MTKIYNQGRLVNGRYDYKGGIKRFFVRLWRFTYRASLIAGAAYAIYLYGGYTKSTHTVEAQVVEAPSPILDRIADCESGNGKAGSATQIGKSGQTLISLNTNNTYDIGKYQINSIHNAEATKLGFNLMTEEGNYGYAKWLYQNKGTGDWSSSARCWQR